MDKKLKQIEEFKSLYVKANIEGAAAVKVAEKAKMIEPMTVVWGAGEHKQRETYSDGACGFAWIIIKPGNCKFANWLKKAGLARPDCYYGGVNIWIGDYNQSHQKKSIHAEAMAQVFVDAGYNASSGNRMD